MLPSSKQAGIDKRNHHKFGMISRPLESAKLFPQLKGEMAGVPDWQLLRTHLSKEGRVLKEDLLKILKRTGDYLSRPASRRERRQPHLCARPSGHRRRYPRTVL